MLPKENLRVRSSLGGDNLQRVTGNALQSKGLVSTLRGRNPVTDDLTLTF
jgi:hypothetical protein